MTGEQAIAIIVQFPILINNIAQAVSQASLGPWSISVNCTYGSCHNLSYTYSIQFTTTGLLNILESAESHSKTFNTSFASVNTWLTNTLPAFSTTFDAAAAAILTILEQAQTSGTLSAAQKEALAAQFTIIQNGLSTSASELSQGSLAMVNYVEAQNAITTQVGQIESATETAIQAALNNLLAQTQQEPCGQSDAQSQFSVIQAEYQNTVSVYSSQFGNLSSDTTNASNAVDAIIGLVTDFIGQIQNISKQLQTVEDGNLPAFIQEVKVQASTQLWTDLAAAAKQQFGNNELEYFVAEQQFAAL